MKKLTDKQQWFLSYLEEHTRENQQYLSPTYLGSRYGIEVLGKSNKHSSTASPTLLQLTEMGLIERSEKGHYRYKKNQQTMKTKFELGPIQKAWIKSLRENPERQMGGQLGQKNKGGTYNACCLGEYALVASEMNPSIAQLVEWDSHGLLCCGNIEYLKDAYSELGLKSPTGELFKPLIVSDDTSYESLSEMNDEGISWPEIADYVEANPHNLFTKPV